MFELLQYSKWYVIWFTHFTHLFIVPSERNILAPILQIVSLCLEVNLSFLLRLVSDSRPGMLRQNLSNHKKTHVMLLEKQCRILSRRTQRLTERFTAVAHKLLSRFGLQSKKKCFSFNRVTSFEREREKAQGKSFQSYKWLALGHESTVCKIFEG